MLSKLCTYHRFLCIHNLAYFHVHRVTVLCAPGCNSRSGRLRSRYISEVKIVSISVPKYEVFKRKLEWALIQHIVFLSCNPSAVINILPAEICVKYHTNLDS